MLFSIPFVAAQCSILGMRVLVERNSLFDNTQAIHELMIFSNEPNQELHFYVF